MLFLPVVFGACALIGLVFPEASLVAETVRDGYEALGIYFFTSFLIDAADGDAALSARLRMKPASAGAHLPPMSMCLRPWPLGSSFLRRCKMGVMQYVVVRLALTTAMLVLQAKGLYAEGNFRLDRGYVYVTILANCSQLVAVYCLLLLLQAAHEELTPMRAWPKLLCVKAVIFFAWWQGVALAAAVQLGVMPSTLDITEQEVAKGLQNLLIVLEMLPAALAHRWAFPVSDFSVPEREVTEAEAGGRRGAGSGRSRRHKRRLGRAPTRGRSGGGGGGKDNGLRVGPRSVSDSDDSGHAIRYGSGKTSLPEDEAGLLEGGMVEGVELAPVGQASRARGDSRRGSCSDDSAAGASHSEDDAGGELGGAQKSRGVFAAMLESALPLDVVTDIRRTVLPTPVKPRGVRRPRGAHGEWGSGGAGAEAGRGGGDHLAGTERPRAGSGHATLGGRRAGGSGTGRSASPEKDGGDNDDDNDDDDDGSEELLMHAAQEYSRRMHCGQTGGAGLLVVAARRLRHPRRVASRHGAGRGVDAVNAQRMAAAAASSLSEARVVQAQASPGTAAASQLQGAPCLPHVLPQSVVGGQETGGGSTMAANRVRRFVA